MTDDESSWDDESSSDDESSWDGDVPLTEIISRNHVKKNQKEKEESASKRNMKVQEEEEGSDAKKRELKRKRQMESNEELQGEKKKKIEEQKNTELEKIMECSSVEILGKNDTATLCNEIPSEALCENNTFFAEDDDYYLIQQIDSTMPWNNNFAWEMIAISLNVKNFYQQGKMFKADDCQDRYLLLKEKYSTRFEPDRSVRGGHLAMQQCVYKVQLLEKRQKGFKGENIKENKRHTTVSGTSVNQDADKTPAAERQKNNKTTALVSVSLQKINSMQKEEEESLVGLPEALRQKGNIQPTVENTATLSFARSGQIEGTTRRKPRDFAFFLEHLKEEKRKLRAQEMENQEQVESLRNATLKILVMSIFLYFFLFIYFELKKKNS